MIELASILENPTAFVALVGTVTAWLKARLNLEGNATIFLSFGVSGGIMILALLSQSYPQLITYMLTVIVGAVGAGGSIDILKGVLKQ